MILALTNGPLAQALGWALLHLVWQGAAVAALLAIALPLLAGRSANLRYVTCCAALTLIVALGVGTGIRSWPERPTSQAVALQPIAGPASLPTVVAISVVPSRPDLWPRLVRAADDALPAIVTLWLVGVILLALRLLVEWQRLRHLLTHGASPACEPWLSAARRLSRAMGVRHVVRLLESTAIDVPAALGVLRPVILIPASAISGLTASQLEMILAHELAHIRRHDFLVNLFQSVVETLLFYHPAVWWISRRIRIEREHCCDDLAVAVCGTPLQYARALTRLEELRAEAPSLALSANGGSLLDRIRRLVRGSAPTPGHVRGVAALMLLVGMLLAYAGPSLSAIAKRAPAGQPTRTTAAPASDRAVGEMAVAVVPQDATTEPAAMHVPEHADAVASAPASANASDFDAFLAAAQAATGAEGGERTQLTLEELIELRSHGVTPRMILDMRFLFPDMDIREIGAMNEVGATPAYVRGLKNAGLRVETPREAMGLAGLGVTPEHVRAWRQAGLSVETAKEASGLAGVGVSSEFVRDLRAAGLPVRTAKEAQGLAALNVTPQYVRELRAAGLDVETVQDAQSLAAVGVTPAYIRDVRAAGLDVDTAEEARGLAAVGVTPAFLRDVRSAGLKVETAEEAQGLAAVGVTSAYVRDVRAAGLHVDSAEELQGLAAVGVTAAYLRDVRAAGLKVETAEEAQGLAAVGVTPTFLRDVRAAGLHVQTAEEAQGLAAVGVTSALIRDLRAAGLAVESAEDAQGLAAVGVTAAYVRSMRATGLQLESAEDLQGLAAVGVTPEWVREMRQAGIPVETADDAQSLRALNVTPQLVRRLAQAGYKNLSVDELQRIAAGGVNDEFIREMRQYKSK